MKLHRKFGASEEGLLSKNITRKKTLKLWELWTIFLPAVAYTEKMETGVAHSIHHACCMEQHLKVKRAESAQLPAPLLKDGSGQVEFATTCIAGTFQQI